MKFLGNIKFEMDDETKKKAILFGGIAAGVLVLIIVISIVVSIANRKTPYEDVESIMSEAAYKYLNANKELLPNETSPETTVNVSVLVEKEYMKELKKYTKDESCEGKVVVKYKDNDYDYQGYLTCKEYKTNLLVDQIKNDNPIVASGDGLYDETDFLRFRGEYVNNYLAIGDIYYRIFKIGADNKIYIIPEDMDAKDDTQYIYWDDRYNSEEESTRGINDYNLSRIKRSLNTIYDGLDDLLKKNITTHYACIGKRSDVNSDNSGLAECSNKVENVNISLLPVYEYIKGSIAPACKTVESRECKNYNYLIIGESNWWTLTADSSNTYKVYYVLRNGEIGSDRGDVRKLARYVVALKPETLLKSGKGTEEEPYRIR